MTSTRVLIDQLDQLELSNDARQARWKAFDDAQQALNHLDDALDSIVDDNALWSGASGPSGASNPPVLAVIQALAEIQVRLRGYRAMKRERSVAMNRCADECKMKQEELVQNTTIIVLKAVEGFMAYRPPEVTAAARPGARRIDLFAMPTTRVDMFNPGLGEPQPPPGPADINDGYADPNAEDAQGVVRARPLVRPDLVKDPTDSVPISNM